MEGGAGGRGDRGAGADVFKPSWRTGGGGNADPAELTGVTGVAGNESAAGDDAAADAGADGDVAEVLGTAAGAETPFGNSGGVGVVVDVYRYAQGGAELLTEGNVGEVAEGMGAADDPRGRVDRPEGTDPDEPQRPGRLGGRVLDLVDYGGDDRRGPAVTRVGMLWRVSITRLGVNTAVRS